MQGERSSKSNLSGLFLLVFQETNDLSDFPNMIANACFHRGSDAQRLVNAAKIVVHEVERERVLVVFHFLRERIRKASESPHHHAHRQILAFRIAGRDVLSVRLSGNDRGNSADTLRRAIASLFAARVFSVQLDEHRVINLCPKGKVNGVQVDFVSVRGQLNAIGEPSRQIVHEVLRVPRRTPTYAPARNEFGIGTNRRPCPNVTVPKLAAQFCGKVLFLRVAERPDFITLDSFARKIAKRFALIFRARHANAREQFNNGIFRNARHSDSGANRITFDKGRDNRCLAFNWECVHA